MTWQELGVGLIVAGAVAFLVLRLTGRRSRKKPAGTFVPLTSIKHRRKDHPDDSGCH